MNLYGTDEKNAANEGFWKELESQITLKQPTRVAIVTSSQSIKVINGGKCHSFFEIARIERDFPFMKQDSFKFPRTGDMFNRSRDSISIVLGLNKESMFRDPVDWQSLKTDLIIWSEGIDLLTTIPQSVDHLFTERAPPNHKARPQKVMTVEEKRHIYQFFNPRAIVENEMIHLCTYGIDAQSARLISKINRHNRFLSVLGILPNQLRALTKDKIDDPELALLDLSKTLFWKGYTIWKRRRALITDYWKNIAREEWKPHTQTRTRAKKKHIKGTYQCTSPFHFLQKHVDLSLQRPTPCPCSRSQNNAVDKGNQDIRSFLNTYPSLNPSQDIYHGDAVRHLTVSIERSSLYTTKEDLIRKDHDRRKRRKVDYY
jgi:hypothetical protein